VSARVRKHLEGVVDRRSRPGAQRKALVSIGASSAGRLSQPKID
jgi:hypothetical protein